MQLYSAAQQRSQALEAHGATFGTFRAREREESQIVAFAQKTVNPGDGSVQAKMHIIELGMQPGNTNAFQKCQTELFFPPELAEDFPVSMQISKKYGLIYARPRESRLLFVNDIETGAAVYRNKISNDPVFIACISEKTGGIYCVNRKGQVILATINESAVVPFVSQQLNNMELALSIAGRASLPGAEALITPRFDALFNSGDFKGAARVALRKYGSLRTMNTIQKFQQAPQQPGSSPPALQYFGACLPMGKLNKLNRWS